jgi:hypothetical protein
VELHPPAANGGDEIGCFEKGQVFAHRLPGHVEPGAELAQGLSVPRIQAVEQLPATRVGKRLEHCVHLRICSHLAAYIRQPRGCMSSPLHQIEAEHGA